MGMSGAASDAGLLQEQGTEAQRAQLILQQLEQHLCRVGACEAGPGLGDSCGSGTLQGEQSEEPPAGGSRPAGHPGPPCMLLLCGEGGGDHGQDAAAGALLRLLQGSGSTAAGSPPPGHGSESVSGSGNQVPLAAGLAPSATVISLSLPALVAAGQGDVCAGVVRLLQGAPLRGVQGHAALDGPVPLVLHLPHLEVSE